MQVKKNLRASLLPDQVNVGISVTEYLAGSNRTVNVQLTIAEFLVVSEMCRYLIPRAVGMHLDD